MRPVRLVQSKASDKSLLPELVVRGVGTDADWEYSHKRFMYGDSLHNNFDNSEVHNAGIQKLGL